MTSIFFLSSEIRLRGRDKASEGRIEVYFGGAWGTVCDDNWHDNMMNGKIACMQLGYINVSNVFDQSLSGVFPNSLDDVDCVGNERNLFECRHTAAQDSDCDNSQDVGVICKTG